MTFEEYKILNADMFEKFDQWNNMSDAERIAYNLRVTAEEETLLEEAGGMYQREIDRIEQQIKILKAQQRGLEVEQARACKKAWFKQFGGYTDGFPDVMRMRLGEVIG